jgi:hypothetical protein
MHSSQYPLHTPSVYFFPSEWEIRFHTHMKQEVRMSYIFQSSGF